jgi:protein-tyrosine-phosphatase
VKKVLFFCTANTCRSSMAQAIFDTLAEDEGLPFRAESACTEALEGTAMAENAVAALEEGGSTQGSTAHGGERGDGRGGRVVLAMYPRQTVALDLLEGDSPLGMHPVPEYTTGVAEEGIPDAYGFTMAATEAPCLSCPSMWNAWWGRAGDYQEPGAPVVE